MTRFYVYEHWRLDKDECFYVGKGTRGRAYSRKGRNTHWRNIVAKLERTGFAYEVKIVVSDLSEDEAFQIEKERISFWKDLVDLSNKTEGGEGTVGYKFSEEQLLRLRPKRLNNKNALGTKMSPETRSKMSESRRGEKHPQYGRSHSEETKKKIQSTLTGRKLSDEFKQKISNVTKGQKNPMFGKPRPDVAERNRSPEQREKVRTAMLNRLKEKREENL